MHNKAATFSRNMSMQTTFKSKQ